MSYPILYGATETNFDHNGIGILSSCVSCEVTEEANGIFELAMQYPMDGVHFAEIGDRAIIKAKVDQFREPQLFRVYAISKPMYGIVSVLAEHISYDLSGIPVKPFSAVSSPIAFQFMKENAVVSCPFDFWTDKTTKANFKVSVPSSIRSRLGGTEGSILDVYGGEYEFDNFTVKLHNSRGQNRGVSIRYGKNLTDIKQDQNCSSVATGVYPYWVDTDGAVLVELPEKIINAPGTYNFVKILTVDLSSEFEEQPTVEQLREKANKYVKDNEIGIPSVSLTVSFAQIEQSNEYKHLAFLERICLFDTVNVEFPALMVSATAKAVKMVYDVIADRVKSITLGSVRSNIADTIAKQGKEIGETAKKEAARAVNGQTSQDVFNRLTDYGRIQGIYIEDGKWYINAETIAAGILSSVDFQSYFNLENGEVVTKGLTDGGFVGKTILQSGRMFFSVDGINRVRFDSGKLVFIDNTGSDICGIYANEDGEFVMDGENIVISTREEGGGYARKRMQFRQITTADGKTMYVLASDDVEVQDANNLS